MSRKPKPEIIGRVLLVGFALESFFWTIGFAGTPYPQWFVALYTYGFFALLPVLIGGLVLFIWASKR
ncbi:hypothetical protein IAD21_04836 [Abditibacteriota bacterium]|nr:hypothetical protein IAD21_04836 [Abditibacteriota bacterium]